MDILSRLATGKAGVRWSVPSGFERQSVDRDAAMLFDKSRGLGWHVGSYPIHLALPDRHHALLVADIECHTRDLFVNFSAARARERPASRPLRTDDPEWSPLISVERVRLGESDALTVLHRMSYQPGDEMIMGHLLVPVRDGLIEFRPIAKAGATGMRESVLLTRAMSESPGEDPTAVMRRLGSRHYDDPAHDDLFPEHPLTRLRRALRWLTDDSGLTVTEPALCSESDEVFLSELDLAFTPPPRYLLMRQDAGFAQFSRVSFAGTDGVRYLTLVADPKVDLSRPNRRAALESYARTQAREAIPAGATEAEVESFVVETDGNTATAATKFVQHGERKRNVWHWRVDERGGVMNAAISAPACVPSDALRADLDAAMKTVRSVPRPTWAKKKWWQF